MSTENVKNIRRWTEHFTRLGAAERAESLLAEFWDADADYYPVRKFPDAQPRHGLEQIAAFYVSYIETWGLYEMDAVRIVPIDDVRLFLQTSVVAQGHGVRPPVEGDLYHSVWLRDGRILRCEDHLTESGALRGLGLTMLPPLP